MQTQRTIDLHSETNQPRPPTRPPPPRAHARQAQTSAPLEGVDEGGLPDVRVSDDPDGDGGLEVQAAAVVLEHAHERLRPHRA